MTLSKIIFEYSHEFLRAEAGICFLQCVEEKHYWCYVGKDGMIAIYRGVPMKINTKNRILYLDRKPLAFAETDASFVEQFFSKTPSELRDEFWSKINDTFPSEERFYSYIPKKLRWNERSEKIFLNLVKKLLAIYDIYGEVALTTYSHNQKIEAKYNKYTEIGINNYNTLSAIPFLEYAIDSILLKIGSTTIDYDYPDSIYRKLGMTLQRKNLVRKPCMWQYIINVDAYTDREKLSMTKEIDSLLRDIQLPSSNELLRSFNNIRQQRL